MYKLKSTRHAKYLLHAHLVFTPKYRKKIFINKHLIMMNEIFQKICNDFGGELIEFNGEQDHVHLLITYPPRLSISAIVNLLKGISSRLLRKEFNIFKKKYWGDSALWSRSYFATSVGSAPLDILKTYIQEQKIID